MNLYLVKYTQDDGAGLVHRQVYVERDTLSEAEKYAVEYAKTVRSGAVVVVSVEVKS